MISVNEAQEAYAKEVMSLLATWGYRADLDIRNEKLGYKIREAQMKKTPLMIVLGFKEAESRTVSVRTHTGETKNDLALEAFKGFLATETQLGGKTH